MSPSIKQTTLDDLLVLKDLSTSTFIESYFAYNTPENMRKYMGQYFSIANLQKELSDANNHFAIAFLHDEPAGYLKLSNSTQPAELGKVKAIEIERIYVTQKHQGKNIGASLMTYCINHAISHNYDTLWLGVWEHNTKAKNFYNKWGFEVFGDHIFLLGHDVQTDLLLKKTLQKTPDTQNP